MGLKDIAKKKGITFGGFPQLSAPKFLENKQFHNLFKQEYDLLVGGTFGVSTSFNKPFEYDFYQVDPFAKFAKENGLLFRGHPLIWGDYNAGWVNDRLENPQTSKAEVNKVLTNEISSKAKHFKGNIHSWDVVNEAIHPDDGQKDGYRDTKWFQHLGSNYIEQCFRLAANNDPEATLVYNDFGLALGNDSSWWAKRREAVLRLLTKLKRHNAPIHALGIQSHLDADGYKKFFDTKTFSKFLQEVGDLGIRIFLTELDINDKQLPSDHTKRDKEAANIFYDYLSVALDNPAVDTVIFWGLIDKYSWAHKNSWYAREDKDNRPLLFDNDYQPKPAYHAVEKALSEAQQRSHSAQQRDETKKEKKSAENKSVSLDNTKINSPNSAEYIRGFVDWLIDRECPTVLAKDTDAVGVNQRLKEYIAANSLPEIRPDSLALIKTPKTQH